MNPTNHAAPTPMLNCSSTYLSTNSSVEPGSLSRSSCPLAIGTGDLSSSTSAISSSTISSTSTSENLNPFTMTVTNFPKSALLPRRKSVSGPTSRYSVSPSMEGLDKVRRVSDTAVTNKETCIKPSEQPRSKKKYSRESSPRLLKTSPRELLAVPSLHPEKPLKIVTFASKSKLVNSDPEKDSDSHALFDKELIKERLINQEVLLNLYQCLKKVVADPKLCLHFENNNFMGCQKVKAQAPDKQKEKDATILRSLYLTINEANFKENRLFFSSKGSPAYLEDLDELITKIYPIRDGDIEVMRTSFLDLIQMCSKKDEEHLRQMRIENNGIPLLQKKQSLYLLKEIKPEEKETKSKDKTLNNRAKLIELMKAKKDETEDLIKEVTSHINSPENEVSFEEKLSALNFYKSRLENYLIFMEFHKASNRQIHEEVLKFGTLKRDQLKIKISSPLCKNPFIKRLSEDIEFITLEKSFEYDKCLDGALDVALFLNAKLPELNSSEMRKFLDLISTDMKIYSAQTFNLITFDTFNLATTFDFPDESARYSNSLFNFIAKTFNAIQPIYKKQHILTENYFNLYMLFVNLGVELINKHDYLSAMAIYTALEKPSIEWIIKEQKELPEAFKENLSRFNKTFNTAGNFAYLREKIAKFRNNKIFHTPSLSIYLRMINNLEKLSLTNGPNAQFKSMQIKDMNDYFNDLRFYFESASKNHVPQTNIFYQISSCTEAIEPIKPALEIPAHEKSHIEFSSHLFRKS